MSTARVASVAPASLLHRADGRIVAWGDYGTPDGVPCFFFHGQPGSRVQARILDEPARRLGVRILAPERPGYGFSTPVPRRRLLDWPGDVTAIADALGVHRFAVVGISGGGPHALACAYALPARVAMTGLLASAPPPELDRGRPYDSRWDVLAGRALRRSHGLERVASALVRRKIVSRPFDTWFDGEFERFLGKLPPADREFLTRPHIRTALVEDVFESFRWGLAGQISDDRAFGVPWGFALGDVPGHVEVWQGGADTQVPAYVGAALAAALPDATLHTDPDGGHEFALDHPDEVLGPVVAALAASTR